MKKKKEKRRERERESERERNWWEWKNRINEWPWQWPRSRALAKLECRCKLEQSRGSVGVSQRRVENGVSSTHQQGRHPPESSQCSTQIWEYYFQLSAMIITVRCTALIMRLALQTAFLLKDSETVPDSKAAIEWNGQLWSQLVRLLRHAEAVMQRLWCRGWWGCWGVMLWRKSTSMCSVLITL